MKGSVSSPFKYCLFSAGEGSSQGSRPVLDAELVDRRLREVLDALLGESALPIGFRALLVQTLPLLRGAMCQSSGRERLLLAHLFEIENAADQYGKKVKRSETFGLLKSFEYELRAAEAA